MCHVCHTLSQVTRNKSCDLYNVRSIPATILFSPGGKVVASDLSGEEPKAKLAEFQEKQEPIAGWLKKPSSLPDVSGTGLVGEPLHGFGGGGVVYGAEPTSSAPAGEPLHGFGGGGVEVLCGAGLWQLFPVHVGLLPLKARPLVQSVCRHPLWT